MRFIDMALEILVPRRLSRIENTIPEKNRGQVRMMAVAALAKTVEDRPPACATHQPRASVRKRRK
jgi:hypothetical protein